ncbi:hypothetical protein [Romboutsia ilealis]|uniref:hypothetical protein n=1 Tax=Romboutsia ilealis TaxID=1115758 RepID=UPI00272BE5DC|nr:hypothetical protein [Romboutsia ilealis]
MQIVKVRKQKVSVKVRLSKKEKNTIKNIISLLLMVGGSLSILMSFISLFMCEPGYSLLAVPAMIKYILVGTVCLFSSPLVKHCIKF